MKKGTPVRIIIIVAVVASAAMFIIGEYAGGFAELFGGGGHMTFLPTGVAVEFDHNSGAVFYTTGGKGFYFATKDGIRYVTEDGKTQMAESYTMQNPVLFGEGQVAAVTEQSGYDAYIYNTQGLMYAVRLQNPIVTFSLNATGYASLVTKKGDDYESFVYNEKGVLIHRSLDTGLIVTGTAISKDNRIWAIAYLDISGAQYNSRITFSYLNKTEAAGYSDSIFASLKGDSLPELNNQYFSIIRFMDGNNLVVITDKSVFCVAESQPSKPKWVVELSNELDRVGFSTSHVALAMGKALLNKQPEPQGRVVLLDTNGNRVFEYDAGEKVTSLSCSAKGVIIGRGRAFTAVGLKGQNLWDYEADAGAQSMFFLDSTEKTLLQSVNNAAVMRLAKISGQTPEAEQTAAGQ